MILREEMEVRYSSVDCPLGRLLVAATRSGICFLSLGETDAPLEAALSSDYPAARINRGPVSSDWIEALLAYLNGETRNLDLPLDVRATEFQRRVWQQLQAIPCGSTRTYGEIALALGYQLTAARAVGRACATNPVSLVIPCHRAVREDGGLGGYRWGLDRKRALLAHERALTLGQAQASAATFRLF